MFIYDIAAGTGQTIILRPGTTCSYFHVSWFMGKYYFASNDGVHGYEPWVSDGTPAGTALFKDIDPAGSNSGYGWFYTPVGGHLYFTAIDPAVGRARLYRTDGSAASTVLVEDDVTQGECLLIKAAGSTLLSIHRDLGTTPYHYYLCATQENLTYTAMIKDLGAGDSDDPEMMSANGLVFFNTVDGINGQQLWVSDGTAAGTGVVQVKTGYPYAQYGFHPARLIQVGNQLFATAYFQSENKEIMKLSLPAVPVPPAQGLDYSVTKENKALFGPNPVKHGDPLCLYFDAAPAKSKWEAYNLAGDRVATLEFESGTDNCWKTEKVAPGIYVLKGEVEYQDGTKKTVKQLVVVKP
jgi:ELWxxDGT repeat protein